MFEHFTQSAIKSIILAQEEARRLGHNFVDSEHLLLGIIGGNVKSSELYFKAEPISLLKEARVEVEKLIGREKPLNPIRRLLAVEIPCTPNARTVLEQSWHQSRQLKHNYVDSKHLLLGVLETEDGNCLKVLCNLGFDLEELKRAVLAELQK